MKRLRPFLSVLFLSATMVLSLSRAAQAGSATWNLNPPTDSWFNTANWTPATIPNGATDVATFGVTNNGFITGMGATLSQINFASNASIYQITLDLGIHTIVGAGVTGNAEKFVLPHGTGNSSYAELDFSNSADAGSSQYVINGSDTDGLIPGVMVFRDNSTGGSAIISLNPGKLVGLLAFADSSSAGLASCFDYGYAYFGQDATAAQGYFEIEGGLVPTGKGGFLSLGDTSHGGSAQFAVQAGTVAGAQGGVMQIMDAAVADSAQIFANDGPGDGGVIQFTGLTIRTAGGFATFQLNGKGTLDISGAGLDQAIGSLAGDGKVFLGSRMLTVGRNILTTAFNGLIQDGGISGGTGGSFAKVGSGTLTLGTANIYTGGTSLNGGTLTVKNTSGSATGPGAVQVNAGNLGGSGIITGPVTIGANNADRPHLTPASGTQAAATLTIQSKLTFNSNGGYSYLLRAKGRRAQADRVNANGVTINSGATFNFLPQVGGTLAAGTSFTVISNTSGNPISGTFSNLADGGIVNVNGNNLQADYEDGDGNDLTLTVVP